MIGFRNNLYLYSSSAYSCNEHCFCLRYSMTPNLACSVTLFLFCYLGYHPFYCFIVQVHACTILLVSFVKKIVIGWQECLPRIVMGIMIDKERATGSTAPERAESSVISVQDRENLPPLFPVSPVLYRNAHIVPEELYIGERHF
jgi:hypothetical protein